MALLEFNEGAGIKAKIIERMLLPVPEKAITGLAKKDKKRKQDSERKKEATSKARRLEKKEGKKKRGKKVVNEEHTQRRTYSRR